MWHIDYKGNVISCVAGKGKRRMRSHGPQEGRVLSSGRCVR